MRYHYKKTQTGECPATLRDKLKAAWCALVGHKFKGWKWNNLRTGGYTCARCGHVVEYWNDLGD